MREGDICGEVGEREEWASVVVGQGIGRGRRGGSLCGCRVCHCYSVKINQEFD